MLTRLAVSTMRRARHHTLIFHRVLEAPDPMLPGEPTAAWFRQLVAALTANFEVISLGEAIGRAQQRRLNGRTVSITFDDGYADNFDIALPILEQAGAPATFFVASGFLDGGRMWNDSIIETYRRLGEVPDEADVPEEARQPLTNWAARRHAAKCTIVAWKHLDPERRQEKVERLAAHVPDLPDDLMMTSAQLRAMANAPGASIGGHTRSHPILASLPESHAIDEIEGGKHELEAIVGKTLDLFAYPNGRLGDDYRQEHALMVERAGFSAAVATDWGTLDASTGRYHVPRFTPWHKKLDRFMLDVARCHHGLL